MKKLLIVLFSLIFITSASAQVGSNVIVGDDSSITRTGNLTSTPIVITNDATPDVSGGSNFITANSVATTITDFDGADIDGKVINIIVNDTDTTFDFTSSSLEGLTSDHVAVDGEVLQFVYSTVDSKWHVLAGGGGGSGDITDVLDCGSGDCSSLYQAPAALAENTTPDVSGASVFITSDSDTTLNTITDFDTDKTNGKMIWVIVNDDYTAFDFTSSGLSGNASDFTALIGDVVQFVYSTTTTQWHYLGFPRVISSVAFTAWPVEIGIVVGDETTDLATGTDKITFRMPWGMSITEIRASVNTAPVGTDLLTVDVNVDTVSAFSTEITFDTTEKTSETAATPSVLTATPLVVDDDSEITVDIDLVGDSTTGKGLKIWLIGTRDI